MPKDKQQSPVEPAGASAAAAATPVAPEPSQGAGDDSGAPGIISEVVEAVEETLAEVPRELSRLEQVVMEWLGDHDSNSPLSRATEALNYVRLHAVPDLLNRIREI